MERPFILENAAERERLRALVAGMADRELSLTLPNGWTIAAALAHLAFWDQRSLVLLRRWRTRPIAASPVDVHVTNDTLLPFFQALPPRRAAELAVAAAEAIDLELVEVPAETIAAIEALGDKFRLYRSIHRRMHLDTIESLLKAHRGGRP